MATSRLSLNSPDWLDLIAVMEAFATLNKVEITLHGKLASVDGRQCLTLLVAALDPKEDGPDQRFLVSQSVNIGPGSHKTIEAAILWALYQLDWKLAEEAMTKTNRTA